MIFANDTLGNNYTTPTNLAVIDIKDTTKPVLNYTSLTDSGTIDRNYINIQINSIDHSSQNMTINLYQEGIFYNSTFNVYVADISQLLSTFTNTVQFINLPEGNYTINATACDLWNNCANLEDRNVSIVFPIEVIPDGGAGAASIGWISVNNYLTNATVETSNIWINGIENKIVINTFNSNNSKIDVKSVLILIDGNQSSQPLFRSSIGTYYGNIKLNSNLSFVNITVIVSQGNTTITKNIIVNVENKNQLLTTFESIKNKSVDFMQNVYTVFNNNKLVFILSISFFLIIIILLVIASYVKKKV
jgi:hypothetical protein